MKHIDSNEVNPLAVFVEELKSSDIKVKLNSIKNLTVICSALGIEKTRSELLPFLSELIEDEDEEILNELTKIIPCLLEYIGGKPHSILLFKLIEILLNLEEQSVKNEAIKSFKTLLNSTLPLENENELINIIIKIASNEWYTQRITAISLIPCILEHLTNENRSMLINYLINFSKDENILIKKEISSNLKEFYGLIETNTYINLLHNVIKDDNDNIKLYVIDNILIMNKEDMNLYNENVKMMLQDISNNDLWKVRIGIAEKIVELMKTDLSNENKAFIIEVFTKFFDDTDSELRNMCCVKLDILCEVLSKNESMLERVLIQLKKVMVDNVVGIRISLANSILKIAPYLGRNKINEYIIPIFNTLIKDENIDVKLNLLKNVDLLCKEVDPEVYLSSVISAFSEIINHKSYRIRIQLISILENLSKTFDSSIFVDKFFVFARNFLMDQVFSVREAACKCIKNILIQSNFNEKIVKSLSEKIEEMTQSQNYLIRNSLLGLFRELVRHEICTDYIENSIEILNRLSKDKMSNVRLNCAIVLKEFSPKVKSSSILSETNNLINMLKKDIDPDVFITLNIDKI